MELLSKETLTQGKVSEHIIVGRVSTFFRGSEIMFISPS